MGTVVPGWSEDRTGTFGRGIVSNTHLTLHFQERIPHPSPTSPHSRLLGSLRRVLINHYCDGMIEEELDFSEIRHSDKLVTGDMYTDISDSLDHLFPDLGGDLWWQKLPSSGRRL